MTAIEQTTCPTPIGYFVLPDGRKAYTPCNKWTCPHCGYVKKHRVLERVGNGFSVQRKGFRVRFLTLTLGEMADNDKIGVYWNRLRASLRKAGYKGYQYFWVKEQTKAGKVHMHVVLDAYIPKRLIKRYWKLATEGTSYIVDIRSPKGLKIESTAAYMAKYMTKSVDNPIGKGQRKYGFSRHAGFRAVSRLRINARPEDKVTFVFSPVYDIKHYRESRKKIAWREEKYRFKMLSRAVTTENYWQ